MFKTKLVKIALAIMVIGAAIIALMIPYYEFNLGVKPCEGLPTDAENCGDGDFGGVFFLLLGAPVVLYGMSLFIFSVLLKIIRPNFNMDSPRNYVYAFIGAFVTLLLLAFLALEASA